jgi:hypothetical protein
MLRISSILNQNEQRSLNVFKPKCRELEKAIRIKDSVKNIVVGATCPNQASRLVYFQAITISSFKGQASYRLIRTQTGLAFEL